MPKSFTQSVIPLIKSKSGDLADVNNDRAIYVSTAISKLFESIIAEHVCLPMIRTNLALSQGIPLGFALVS